MRPICQVSCLWDRLARIPDGRNVNKDVIADGKHTRRVYSGAPRAVSVWATVVTFVRFRRADD